jgi:PAS domain S-box-containing protein
VSDIPGAYSPDDSAELLVLAEQIGRIGVIDWQVQSGTVRMSATALAIYGLDTFDGRYDTWIATVHREDRARLQDTMANALAEKAREFELDFRVVRQKDNALRWIQARRLVFYDTAGTPVRVVGVSVDITERKRELVELRNFTEALEAAVKERTRELEAENEARKKTEELLRQSQKMEAVGQLTGGVAHDFNNLLTIVMGGLDMIGRQLPNLQASAATARITRGRDIALEGVRRAAALTSRLLAFSRQQPLAPKIIDANKLVSGLTELVRRALGDAVVLETVLAAGLWRTEADPNQLESAILNLALNARDSMPDGGKVTIETANCYIDKAYVSGLSEPVAEGQYVMIAVADTGVGMDRATIERAFEPFFTTKEVGKGTGLGLSQVYGFVRQSAGHVKIYSEPGQGTTVKIYLRRSARSEDESVAHALLRDAAQASGSEIILVVEDDAALRAYAVEILTELGYRVVEADSGAAALNVLDRLAVDLLFTDVVMPGMNGREIADEATRRHPGLKVLFTTGYTRNAIVHHGRLDAGVHMIGKPYTFDELGARVRALLDS